MSADDQSEDGELRQSPNEMHDKHMELSGSEEDEGDKVDSLVIKPPQAIRISQNSRSSKKREGREAHTHHKRSERRHEEKGHSHREKHHREKRNQSSRDRDHYRREKSRNLSYQQPKYRRDRYDEKHKEKASKTLQDLRERLINKRTMQGDEVCYEQEPSNSRRDSGKYRDPKIEMALRGSAGAYVKEIIDISTGDDKRGMGRKGERVRDDDRLTEKERAEQELRREKLLEAEREMARQKEQSRLERQRRNMEKGKRKVIDEDDENEEEEDVYHKRSRLSEDEGSNVVTVSDNSEEEYDESDKQYEDEDEEVEEEEEDEEGDKKSEASYRSRSSTSSRRSRTSSVRSDRNRSSESREASPVSERKESEHSTHSEKSRSPSPKSNGKAESVQEEEESEVKEKEVVKIDEDLPPYFPAIQGCRSVEEFQCLNRIEEGTYGVVYRARDKRTEEIVALKRLKMEKEKEGFPITSLREINTLLKGQHPNIVTVREIVVGSNMDKIFIVMDYVEHDLKSLMETMKHKKQMFMPGEIKCLLSQLLAAVAHLHDNWILHRDLKTSNLLLSHKGILKVGDFGLAREYGSPLKAYTPIVVTLWYRAPELLLCAKEYSTPIDVWSVGCIFAELVLMNVLFPGKSEVDQLNRIFKDLGTPSEKIWPGFNKLPAVQKMKFTEYPVSNLRSKFHTLSELGLGLLIKFLTFDPSQRITAEEALQHPYFKEAPLPIDPAMFPTWPAKSELGHRRALAASPKPPSGGKEYKQLERDDDGLGFRIGMSAAENRRMPVGGGFSLKF